MAHDGTIVKSPWNSGANPKPMHPGGSERSDPSRPYPPLGRQDLLGAGANVKLDDADFHHPHSPARQDLLGMHAGVKLDKISNPAAPRRDLLGAGANVHLDDSAFHHPHSPQARRDNVQGRAEPGVNDLNRVRPARGDRR